MKKILFFGALVAMLLGTAACSSDMEPTMGGEVPVSFAINLGDNIDSRTISDGLKANQLKFAVFENGAEITALAQEVPVANKQATVTTKLVKGHTYTFVFWAQNSACTAYNTTNMSAITVDYTANCNDETRDAFYKMDSFTVTEAFEKTEVLTRPFAQINFLADDAAGVVGVNAYKSKVTVTGVPTTLNTLDGTVGTETTDVTFALATIPNETLAGYESYKYVAMNYILAATDKEVKNEVVLTVNDGTQDVNTVTVANCPVQRNYRTNIFGSLFTLEGKFNIEIDPIYEGEFNLPEKENVVTMNGQEFENIVAAYNAAIEAGQTDIVMTLAKGTYEIPSTFAFEKLNTRINLTVQGANGVNPADITINGRFAISAASGQRVANGSSMTIKGVSFTTTNTAGNVNNASDQYYPLSDNKPYCIYSCGAINLTVENCIFNNSDNRKSTAIYTWGAKNGTTVVKNCVFNGGEAGKSINFANGASNTVEGCTFNRARDYAVQVNGYSSSDTRSQLIFKNNIINHPDNKLCYGLVLDSRQNSYYNLDITVENNVMTGGCAITWNSTECNSYLYAHSDNAAWETVTVNNSNEWGIYYPDAQ